MMGNGAIVIKQLNDTYGLDENVATLCQAVGWPFVMIGGIVSIKIWNTNKVPRRLITSVAMFFMGVALCFNSGSLGLVLDEPSIYVFMAMVAIRTFFMTGVNTFVFPETVH